MLFDSRAHALPDVSVQIKYPMDTTPDGGVETDADRMLQSAERAIDEILAQAGRRAADIAAVASDTFAATILGVDGQGRAVTPLYLYSDSRGAREVDQLRARFDGESTHQRVGTLFHTSYLPARLLWLAHERADSFARAQYWMSLGEYLLFRWTGRRACSFSIASWTGLLNRARLEWDAELLAALPVRFDMLSPLVDHDQPVGTLRDEYRARWQALGSAKWFPAMADGAAANVGSGCIDAPRMALTIGTSSAIRVVVPAPAASGRRILVPRGLWSYRVTRDRELIGGALSEGGNLFAWMETALRLDDVGDIESELAALTPDSHGLTLLPFLAGERAPDWVATARGAIAGLSLNTRPIDILRAGMEAVAYRLGLVFDRLRGVAPDSQALVASGGALMKSPVWIQIIADTLGMPVIASAEPEATSRGTALLALKAIGVIKSLEDLPAELGTAYRPDLVKHEIYARATARQEKLYNNLVVEKWSGEGL
jgi:gluconokinase